MVKDADVDNIKKKKLINLFSIEVSILIIIFIIALVSFVLIAQSISDNSIANFDLKAFKVIDNKVSNVNTGIMQFFTF